MYELAKQVACRGLIKYSPACRMNKMNDLSSSEARACLKNSKEKEFFMSYFSLHNNIMGINIPIYNSKVVIFTY